MVREAWTDERLDDLSKHMDQRFDRVEHNTADLRAEMNRRFDKVDERFDKIDERFDKVDARFHRIDERFGVVETRMDDKFDRVHGRLDDIQRTMMLGAVSLTAAMLAGFAAMVTLVATQL